MIILTIKQLKRRVVQGLVEPKLFYMPVKKNNEPKILSLTINMYRVHYTNYERIYHGWTKRAYYDIDNTNTTSYNYSMSSGDVILSDNIIGQWKISNDYHMSGKATVELHNDKIKYYGMHYQCFQENASSPHSCHKNNLLNCVKTASPNCTFSVNGSNSISFRLLDLYLNSIDEFLDGFYKGQFTWFVFYDCADNAIKSQISLTNNTDGTSKYAETIVYENYL